MRRLQGIATLYVITLNGQQVGTVYDTPSEAEAVAELLRKVTPDAEIEVNVMSYICQDLNAA